MQIHSSPDATRCRTLLTLAALVVACCGGTGCASAQGGGAAAEAPQAPGLLPVPQAAELEKATAMVADIFKSDIGKAKTPLQKREVAKKLLRSASETKDDPLGRFALLQMSTEFAAGGGDLPTASLAIDQQARSHEIDELKLKVQAAEAAAKAVRFPTQHESFASDLLPLLHASILADRYDYARRLGEMLVHSAHVARKPKLAAAADRLAADVGELDAEYERLADSLARHKALAAQAADKLELGKFYCFLKGEWSVGLPLLAEGGDGPASQIAADELASPTEGSDQLKLADAWWTQGDSLEGLRKRRLRQHAAAWYVKVLPQLAGLSAARATRNIEAANENDLSHVPTIAVVPTEPVPSSPALALIDLLALSSEAPLARQIAGGEWSRTEDGVVSGESAYVRLSLPYRVKGPYELEVEFTIQGGKDESVALVLPVDDRQTLLCIDGWVSQGRRTYLCNVNGREAINNPSAVRGKLLKRGQLHNAHVDVSWDESNDKAQVIFTLDGRHIFTWSGRTGDLSLQAGWEMPRPGEIGLASYVTERVRELN